MDNVPDEETPTPLSVAGRRLPLIFDEQGELLEPQVLEQLFMSPPSTRQGALDANPSD